MQANREQRDYVPWRERAFVSIAEAAQILSRTEAWVRDRLYDGRLRAFQLTGAGRLCVSVDSILQMESDALLASPRVLASLRARTPRAGAPALRLITDNRS